MWGIFFALVFKTYLWKPRDFLHEISQVYKFYKGALFKLIKKICEPQKFKFIF